MKEFLCELLAHKTGDSARLPKAEGLIQQGLTFSEIERILGINKSLEKERIRNGNILDHEKQELEALNAK